MSNETTPNNITPESDHADTDNSTPTHTETHADMKQEATISEEKTPSITTDDKIASPAEPKADEISQETPEDLTVSKDLAVSEDVAPDSASEATQAQPEKTHPADTQPKDTQSKDTQPNTTNTTQNTTETATPHAEVIDSNHNDTATPAEAPDAATQASNEPLETQKNDTTVNDQANEPNVSVQDDDTAVEATAPVISDAIKNADLNIALAQHSFMVGSIEDNVKKMTRLAEEAKTKGADIIVFPELAIIGYPPEDLLLRRNLSTRIQIALKNLAKVEDIVIIVGYPHSDHHGCFNSAAILHNGKQRGFYHKQHLPNYGVFDEKRYFDAGKNHVCFDYKGRKVGLLICEDVWKRAPIKALKNAGADVVISINASPFATNKQTKRKEVLKSRVKETELPIIYLNKVGGQDDLVFDGGSMAVNADGSIPVELNRFIEKLEVVSLKGNCFEATPQPLMLTQEAQNYYALVIGLRDYVKNSGFKSALLGLSGGIDSALTLCIAVDALGADNVYAVMMPYEYTSSMSLEDAQAQAKRLGVSYTVAPIHAAYQGVMQTLLPLLEGTKPDTTEENLQARIRGTMLMALSNKFGHMVLATGNKSELAVGYATLYGDMCGGFAALKDVYKTDVYALATYRNSIEDSPVIPERVITRPPSAELRPDQVDQDSLPDYDTLDKILSMYIDQQRGINYMIKQGFDSEVVKRVVKMVDRNEYKRRQGAPGSKIGYRAFGRERRYPIVNGWLKGL